MANNAYLTAPVKSTKVPSGIPYIVANEAAERFSYYGMRGILVIFMTKYLLDSSGVKSPMTEAQAKESYHLFMFAAYFFPFFGSILADVFWGKYRTILTLSIVYCLGHLALALDETRLGLGVGLTLIAIGAGGIKPCVSAHVGDQFGASNQHHLSKVFGWFYFSINAGSFISMLLTPVLLAKYGPHIAFGVPGVLMFIATIFFWMGRRKFVHIPPSGMGFIKEAFSEAGLKCIGKLCVIYAFIAIFWSLYDQTGSSWVLQAEKMDLHWLGRTWESSQIQAINPILILVYIPLFTYVINPIINKIFPLTMLRKIGLGLLLTASPFVLLGWVETQIVAGLKPSIGWQALAYVLITAAEVYVSITGLEFSYTQAPKKMKSLIMALFYLSVSAGNLFTAAVNYFIQNPDGSTKITGPQYFYFFAAVMFVTAIIFVLIAKFFKEQTFIQDEAETPAATASAS